MTIKETQAVYYTIETINQLVELFEAIITELESGVLDDKSQGLVDEAKVILKKLSPPEQDPLVIDG